VSRTAEAQAPGTKAAVRPTKIEGWRIPREERSLFFTAAEFASPYCLRVLLMLHLGSRTLIFGWAILRLLAALSLCRGFRAFWWNASRGVACVSLVPRSGRMSQERHEYCVLSSEYAVIEVVRPDMIFVHGGGGVQKCWVLILYNIIEEKWEQTAFLSCRRHEQVLG
jgi:hypothetical protein